METEKDKLSLFQAGVLLAVATAAFYLITRAVFISFAGYSTFEKVVGITFFLSELFIMLHGISFFWGMFRLSMQKNSQPPPADDKATPAVAILIPARHEPQEILENTISSASDISYPNKNIYLLDDSSIEEYKEQAQKIADKYGCKLFRRQNRHGAKAGVINDCLRQLDEKYVAVFDVDQAPMDIFLSRTVPVLEANPELAFIQTPQYYSHLTPSKVSHGANMQQAIFYEYVCEFKNIEKIAMCCGTNVIFRTEAVLDVGGFDEDTVTEDFATSLKLHSRGWKSIYDKRVGAIGQGPLNLSSYLAQQNRWAQGTVEVFKKIIKTLLRTPSALKPIQWIEYFTTGSYYLVSWAYLFLIILPAVYVFFSVPSFFMNPFVYGLTYVPYLIFSKYAFYSNMRKLDYTYPQIWQGQFLLFISLPEILMATFAGLVGVKSSFKITDKESVSHVPYNRLWPQIVLCMVNLCAIMWGVSRFFYERNMAVLVNCAWVTYHFLLTSSVFYFNEDIEEVAPAV